MSSIICTNCGHTGNPTKHTRGSFLIELVLWLTFIVPGLIYSLWRLTTKERVCRKCGSSNLVPADTPRGRKLMEEFSTTEASASR
jgi:hypothetical protein